MNNNEIAIKVDGFSKKYRGREHYAVKDASFEVRKGEFHGFIGANGAGKTTTIKSLVGAYASYEGKVTIFGMPNDSIEAKKKLGYIPENAKFPTNISVQWYISQMAMLTGMSWKEGKAFADETLKKTGLWEVRRKSPNSFSSGQKKKVLLAQALVGKPELLIMDEPAANLDPKARKEFFESLKNLQKDGLAIFVSSHILSELDYYADAITILDGGKVVYTGTKEEIAKRNEGKLLYVIKLSEQKDEKALTDFLKEQKFDFSKNERSEYIFDIISLNNYEKVTKWIHTSKVQVELFKQRIMTLVEIYDEYVIKGSMDTGVGVINV